MAILLWANICLALFIFSSNGTILRLPCKKVAVFDVFHAGKRLLDHVLMSFNGLQDIQCMVKCVENVKCRSYNTNTKDGRCEINGKALFDNGTTLSTTPDWLHKSTDYNSTLVGPVCEALKPCADTILCKDSCDPPYYKCVHCDNDHMGLHCDVPIDRDECSSNPCQNSGVCIDKFADYQCTCSNGFTGKNCEIDIDECSSLPCFNGGTCINEIGNYTCDCTNAIGYDGRNCEKDRDECASNPCQNSGTCVDKFAGYQCTCSSGVTGKNCEIDIDECLSPPCLNGGTCVNTVGNYTCNCTNAVGYTGRHCQTVQFIVVEEHLTWEQSGLKCKELGGDLASIGSKAELEFLKTFLSSFLPVHWFWVGLNDRSDEGEFVWSDGTSNIEVQWAVNEPKGGNVNNCVYLVVGTVLFHDHPCNEVLYPFCKLR